MFYIIFVRTSTKTRIFTFLFATPETNVSSIFPCKYEMVVPTAPTIPDTIHQTFLL